MSAYRWIELVCEGDNCGQNFMEHLPTGSFESARREAKAAGWQRVKMRDSGPLMYQDRCPDCTTCVVA